MPIIVSQGVQTGGLKGIGFYLLRQLTGHLAGILGLNPALLILAPPFVLLAVAVMMIRHHRL